MTTRTTGPATPANDESFCNMAILDQGKSRPCLRRRWVSSLRGEQYAIAADIVNNILQGKQIAFILCSLHPCYQQRLILKKQGADRDGAELDGGAIRRHP